MWLHCFWLATLIPRPHRGAPVHWVTSHGNYLFVPSESHSCEKVKSKVKEKTPKLHWQVEALEGVVSTHSSKIGPWPQLGFTMEANEVVTGPKSISYKTHHPLWLTSPQNRSSLNPARELWWVRNWPQIILLLLRTHLIFSHIDSTWLHLVNGTSISKGEASGDLENAQADKLALSLAAF